MEEVDARSPSVVGALWRAAAVEGISPGEDAALIEAGTTLWAGVSERLPGLTLDSTRMEAGGGTVFVEIEWVDTSGSTVVVEIFFRPGLEPIGAWAVDPELTAPTLGIAGGHLFVRAGETELRILPRSTSGGVDPREVARGLDLGAFAAL